MICIERQVSWCAAPELTLLADRRLKEKSGLEPSFLPPVLLSERNGTCHRLFVQFRLIIRLNHTVLTAPNHPRQHPKDDSHVFLLAGDFGLTKKLREGELVVCVPWFLHLQAHLDRRIKYPLQIIQKLLKSIQPVFILARLRSLRALFFARDWDTSYDLRQTHMSNS